jgi:hypothetical protein
MATKKYRPYFSLSELKKITDSVRAQNNLTDVGLILYLEKYISDIEHAFRKENHITVPSILEQLTKEKPDDNPNSPQNRYTRGEMDEAEAKEFERSQGIHF